jgi:hypothetical protein
MATDVLFQCTLQDLIKGIRQQKKDSSSFLSKSIQDIKSELKSSDPYIKAEAVRFCCVVNPKYFAVFNVVISAGAKNNLLANDWFQCELGVVCGGRGYVSTEICS